MGTTADRRGRAHDSRLVNEVAELLVRVVDQAREIYGEILAVEGLTELQWLLLRKLQQTTEPPPIGLLATWLNTEPPTVTALVDRLEARGLLVRTPDPSDRRRKRIHLTDDARTVLARIDAAAEARTPCRHLRPAELDDLRGLLLRMIDAE